MGKTKKKKVTVVVGVAVGDNGAVEHVVYVDPNKEERKLMSSVERGYDESSFTGCGTIEVSLTEFTLNVPKTKKVKTKKVKAKKVATVEKQEQAQEQEQAPDNINTY